MFVFSMLRVDLQYCVRVHALSIHCTCHVRHPKAGMEGAVVSSTFSSNCASSAAQDVGTRNRTVICPNLLWVVCENIQS